MLPLFGYVLKRTVPRYRTYSRAIEWPINFRSGQQYPGLGMKFIPNQVATRYCGMASGAPFGWATDTG